MSLSVKYAIREAATPTAKSRHVDQATSHQGGLSGVTIAATAIAIQSERFMDRNLLSFLPSRQAAASRCRHLFMHNKSLAVLEGKNPTSGDGGFDHEAHFFG